MDSIYVSINAGKYKVKLEYPAKPVRPPVLSKYADLCNDEELRTIRDVKIAYAKATDDWRNGKEAYGQEEGRLIGVFWDDVAEEYGIPKADKFFEAMMGLAWQRGHSGGLSDVLNAFDDMVPLYHLYAAK